MKEPWSKLPLKRESSSSLNDADGYQTGKIRISQDSEYIIQCCNNFHEATNLLREAKLQIEYLHGKFQETSTGNSVLARIDTFLNKLE